MKSIFPEQMLQSELSLESVAGKLLYFQEQIHLLHWQTSSYATHVALGKAYEYIQDFRDDVIEKLMGYTGKRVRLFKLEGLSETASASIVANDVVVFAQSLKSWAESNQYNDIANMADSLSGEFAKLKYLLTLS